MKAKTISIIQIIYGLLGSMFGGFALLIIFLQKLMLKSFPSGQIKDYADAFHNSWLIFSPLMIIIGLLYAISGFLIYRKKKLGILLGVFSAMLNIVWFVNYAISLYKNVVPVMLGMPIISVNISMAVCGFIICVYPTFFIFNHRNINLNEAFHNFSGYPTGWPVGLKPEVSARLILKRSTYISAA